MMRVLACCRGLRRLRLWGTRSGLEWSVLTDPSISDLKILALVGAENSRLRDPLLLPTHPFPFHLQTLTLLFDDVLPSAELLDRLLDAGHSSLRSLTVKCADADPPLYPLLQPKFHLIASTLTHLSVPRDPFPTSLLPLCATLLTLTLNTCDFDPIDQPALRAQIVSLGKALPLPPTVTTLEFIDDDGTETVNLSVFSELLRCRSFAKLERVLFSEGDWYHVLVDDVSGEFWTECEEREIAVVGPEELSCGNDWRHDPEELSEDDGAEDSDDSEGRSESGSEDDG